jgi:hypothetical protein
MRYYYYLVTTMIMPKYGAKRTEVVDLAMYDADAMLDKLVGIADRYVTCNNVDLPTILSRFC